MSMYLLFEGSDIKQKIDIVKQLPNKVKFNAILQSCDLFNRNKRNYPLRVMREGLEVIRPRLKEKTFGGTLDHPIPSSSNEDANWMQHVTYLYKDASHAITNIWIEDNLIKGTIETLSTPNGRTLAGLINDGVKVGFSLRAISDNIERTSQGDIVGAPITIISYDAVSFPSHPEAHITEITATESALQQTNMQCENGLCYLTEHYKKYHNKEYAKILTETNIHQKRKYGLFECAKIKF